MIVSFNPTRSAYQLIVMMLAIPLAGMRLIAEAAFSVFLMEEAMRYRRAKNNVIGTIISFYAVNVVTYFCRLQIATKLFLHYKTVLKHVAVSGGKWVVINSYPNIALRIGGSALVKNMCWPSIKPDKTRTAARRTPIVLFVNFLAANRARHQWTIRMFSHKAYLGMALQVTQG